MIILLQDHATDKNYVLGVDILQSLGHMIVLLGHFSGDV